MDGSMRWAAALCALACGPALRGEVALRPGADVEGQLARIRALRASSPGPLTVRVAPGVYALQAPIRLTAADAGLSFVADGEGEAVFSGGRALGPFRDTGRGWWEADAAGVDAIQQLTVNGRFARVATSPNEGYYYVKDAPEGAKDVFTAEAADVAPLAGLTAAERARVRVPLYQSWDMGLSALAGFDAARGEVRVSPGCTRAILFWNTFRPRFKLQNLRAALDAPGEWFQEGEKVLYVPRAGEAAATSVAVAAVAEKLLDIQGATNVSFRGITFAHARLQIEGRGFINAQAQIQLPAAVETRACAGIAFDRCRFAHLGPHALWLGRGTEDARVTRCLFEDLGAGGIYIGATSFDKRTMRATASRILVRDNIIRAGGRLADGAHGVWMGHAADVAVEHNEIADFHYTGIASGWRWGYAPTPTRRIRIAWNHIHHIGNGILSDMAAIYTLGEHAGSEIVGNRIHDVWCYGQAGRGGRGIYADEGTAHLLVASNLVYDISSGPITQHYGKDNRFVNNILAFSRGTGEMVYHARVEPHRSFVFDHNIVVWEGAREAVHSWDRYAADRALSDVSFDNNVWWRYDGDAAADEFNHLDYAAWRKLGADPHGCVADPLFKDARGLDFDLADASPARARGFVPWDWRAAGVTGDDAWRRRAAQTGGPVPRVPRAPLYVPKEKARPLAATLHVAGHEHGLRDRALPLARAAGIGTVRGGIYLQQVVRPDGTFDFSRSDATLAACEKAGVEWLPILFSTARTPPVWEDLPRWRAYVRALATRYRGRIRAWEVWNEQNIAPFWFAPPDPTNYVSVLRAAYEEVKAADPAARVAIGGFAGVPCAYIEEVYRNGGGAYFDIMNVHPYVYLGAPEGRLEARMEQLRAVMGRHGDGRKAVWFTEIGWPTHAPRVMSKEVLLTALARIDAQKADWRIVMTDEEPTGSWAEEMRRLLPRATVEEVAMRRFPAWLVSNCVDVVVFPHSGRYDRAALAAVEARHFPRGGVLACLSGVPLCFSCSTDGEGNVLADERNAGFAARPRLGIALLSEHTDARIPPEVVLENGKKAQRFFGPSARRDVSFVPFDGWRARTNGLDLVAAGMYRREGGRRGTIVVSGMREPRSRASSEARQAQLLPRAIATALQLGVERYFIYEFQAMEKDAEDPESHFGIVHADLSPKPAYEALKTFHAFRPDGSRDAQGWAPRRTAGGVRVFQWMRPDGVVAGMLWSPSRPGVRRLKFLTPDVRVHDAAGRPLAARADRNGRLDLPVGEDVVYYVGAAFTREGP